MNYKVLVSALAILAIVYSAIIIAQPQSESATKPVVTNETQTNGPVMVTGANHFALKK